MNQNELKKAIAKLPLGDIRYFDTIGSTNNEALAWATGGAKDLSLVVADEQTAGRGRLNRKWFTPKGTALAFSVIVRPTAEEKPYLTRIVGWAALAIAEALRGRGLVSQIKWPNDVLLNGYKVAGVLVETTWSGDDVDCVVVGIGVNVLRGSVPPDDLLSFPATSLEEALGPDIKREEVLHDILAGLIALRPQLGSDSLIASWEKSLAFLGEHVQVEQSNGTVVNGKILGLEADGSLRVGNEAGRSQTVRFGDVHLRPQA
jgi:BirA family biotin operon repressor/biotin-[acetyl-CoA-carboxylase] ligase